MKLSVLIVFLLLSCVTALTEKEARFTPVGEKITLAPAKYHKEVRDTKHTTSHLEELYAPNNELGDIRYKRQSDDMTVEDNHTYYLSTFYPSESGVLSQLWVDLSLNTSHHVVLSNSYLKYLSIPFELPFYGHQLDQVAITTAGFISTFDSPHPYLHLTQYIAPYSADFNPSQNSESKIYYLVEEERIIVLWDKLTLNGRSQMGFFTFETIVYKNGTIQFLYKDIPGLLNETSTSNYTSLIGVADAFLADLLGTQVIFNYHRVRLGEGMQLGGTVYQLDPVQNCISADSWNTCRNVSCYSSFSCGWCTAVQRCSDGIDRHRQSWVDEGCSETDSLTCESTPPPGPSTRHVGWVLGVLVVIPLCVVGLITFITIGVVIILVRRNKKKEVLEMNKYATM